MAPKKTAKEGKPTADVMKPAKTERPPDDGGPRRILDEDLMIFDEEGNFYRLRKEQYLRHRIVRGRSRLWLMRDQMEHLIKQGVVLADLPQGRLKDVGCACYLVNLAGIRRVEEQTGGGGPNRQVGAD